MPLVEVIYWAPFTTQHAREKLARAYPAPP